VFQFPTGIRVISTFIIEATVQEISILFQFPTGIRVISTQELFGFYGISKDGMFQFPTGIRVISTKRNEAILNDEDYAKIHAFQFPTGIRVISTSETL